MGLGMSVHEQWEAEEKGRLLAAAMVAENPEARARVEAVYGKAYCEKRWPEAYSRSMVPQWARKALKTLVQRKWVG